MPIATLAEVKAYSGIPSATDDDNALLQVLIVRAQNMIENHTHRRFDVAADTTRYFDVERDVGDDYRNSYDYRYARSGRRTLYLDEDLCAITSITNGDGALVTSSQYITQPRNNTPWYAIKLRENASVEWTYDDTPEDAIVIVGRWGYSTTPPGEIVHALVRLVHFLYYQKDNAAEAERPIYMGNATILPGRLPVDVLDILGRKPGDKYVKAIR